VVCRDLEARGRARATITRRLCTIAGFYRYAVEQELLDHFPAVHVRRPQLDYESHAVGLDRNEVGALLVAAGLGPVTEHALISLLAINGLQVSEATGANTEALGIERGHRMLVIIRKGGEVVTIPSKTACTGSTTWTSANTAPRSAPRPAPASWSACATWSSPSCGCPGPPASPPPCATTAAGPANRYGRS
jgi:site-specific recombinase XerD